MNISAGGVFSVTGIGSSIQAHSAELDALTVVGTSGTGFTVQTGVNTVGLRSISGTASQITVTNGSGVSGSPTIAIDPTYPGQTSITTVGTLANPLTVAESSSIYSFVGNTTGSDVRSYIQLQHGGTRLASFGHENNSATYGILLYDEANSAAWLSQPKKIKNAVASGNLNYLDDGLGGCSFGVTSGSILKWGNSSITPSVSTFDGTINFASTATVSFGGTASFANIVDNGVTANGILYANGSKQLSSVTLGAASNGASLSFASGVLSTTNSQDISSTATVTFANVIDNGVIANGILYANGSKQLSSVTLGAASNGSSLSFSGGVLSSTNAQDISSTANPTFNALTLNGQLQAKVNSPVPASFISTSTTNSNEVSIQLTNTNSPAPAGVILRWDSVTGIQIQDTSYHGWLVQGGTTVGRVQTYSGTVLDNGVGRMSCAYTTDSTSSLQVGSSSDYGGTYGLVVAAPNGSGVYPLGICGYAGGVQKVFLQVQSTGVIQTLDNILDSGTASTIQINSNYGSTYMQVKNSAVSKCYYGYDSTNGITIYQDSVGPWLYQGGSTNYFVRTHSNILDNGSGTMSVLNLIDSGLTANAIVYANGSQQLSSVVLGAASNGASLSFASGVLSSTNAQDISTTSSPVFNGLTLNGTYFQPLGDISPGFHSRLCNLGGSFPSYYDYIATLESEAVTYTATNDIGIQIGAMSFNNRGTGYPNSGTINVTIPGNSAASVGVITYTASGGILQTLSFTQGRYDPQGSLPATFTDPGGNAVFNILWGASIVSIAVHRGGSGGFNVGDTFSIATSGTTYANGSGWTIQAIGIVNSVSAGVVTSAVISNHNNYNSQFYPNSDILCTPLTGTFKCFVFD